MKKTKRFIAEQRKRNAELKMEAEVKRLQEVTARFARAMDQHTHSLVDVACRWGEFGHLEYRVRVHPEALALNTDLELEYLAATIARRMKESATATPRFGESDSEAWYAPKRQEYR